MSNKVHRICFGLALASTAALLSCSTFRGESNVQEPPTPYPFSERRIFEGAVVHGKLWLRSGDDRVSDGLVSVDLVADTKINVFDRDVIDIERANGRLWVLRSVDGSPGNVTVLVSAPDGFKEIAKLAIPTNDAPIALSVSGERPVIMSERSAWLWSELRQDWDIVRLSGPISSPNDGTIGQISIGMPSNMHALYVGHNGGEFGGGLQRIDLVTGTITRIEKVDGREYPLGESLLSPRVTGIIADPANPDCVLVSIGLVHFVSSGNIARACGGNIDIAFENLFKSTFLGTREMTLSEAMYGIARGPGGSYWAMGILGLYEFRPNASAPIKHAIPEMMSIEGIAFSRAIPGIIVLRTDVNSKFSLSGDTPLVVSIE
jgi:hypothetical protein